MKDKALRTTIIAIMCTTFSLYAEIDTNKVDWTSTGSVLFYLDELVSEFGSAKKVSRPDLAYIKVPVNDLLRMALEFDITTNDYDAAASMIARKEEVLRLIASLPSFSARGTNRVVITAFLAKVQPLKDTPRGKPVPPPILINPFDIKPNDPPERIAEIKGFNEVIATNNAFRVAIYEEDHSRRKFYKKLDSLHWFLHSFIPISAPRQPTR